ncbi:MAG: DUF6010 family protein [Bacteroidota bacterium]
MIAVIIGMSLGFLIILIIALLKSMDKEILYGLILSGIGFLYVGFTWTDPQALIVNCVQATLFLLLSYYGIKKSIYFLIAGYFLHGSWDILYSLFARTTIIPPHYDLFCLSVDFYDRYLSCIAEFRLKNHPFLNHLFVSNKN